MVLGLSQGSVSELLSKPKPWHMLSIKGREPFIRMQLWLNDPNNIEKLQTLKNERREANKRRRTHMDDGGHHGGLGGAFGKSLDSQLFNFSSTFANSLGGALGKAGGVGGLSGLAGAGGLMGSTGPYSMSPVSSQPTVKKARILFTEEQKEALRIAFAMDPYPSSTTAEFLAKELNLSIRTITNWFHNHRMRLKQINTTVNNGSGGGGDESNPSTTTLPYSIGRDGVSFDQGHFRNLLAQRLSELKLRAAATSAGGGGGNGSSGNNGGGNGGGSSNNSSNGSSASSQSSHNFGSHFGGGGSPQHMHHRFKYASSALGGGGAGVGLSFQSQSAYSNNSCSSPGSTSPFREEEDDDDDDEDEIMAGNGEYTFTYKITIIFVY